MSFDWNDLRDRIDWERHDEWLVGDPAFDTPRYQRPVKVFRPPPFKRTSEALAEIPARVYVEVLFGVEVPPSGQMRCPLPDHDERTASFKVYEGDGGHYCFGCGRGGTIIDAAACLYGLEPRGSGWVEICRRLEAEFRLEAA